MSDASPELLASHRYCHGVTRQHAKSFHFASHALPPHKRAAARAIYAFCRFADDLLDMPPSDGIADPRASESELNLLLNRLYEGTETEVAFAAAFHHTVTRFGIPRQPFTDLVHGVCMDRLPIQIETWEELERYCYHVASVVGLVMCPVLGLSDPKGERQAIDLGIAMQLTNILRDVGEDLDRGRRYLPAEELYRFGVDPADLQARRPGDGFIPLLKFQIARARQYYERSEPGIALLARDGSQRTVWLMRRVYAGILDEIERNNFDVLNRRAYVPLWRKLVLAARCWYR
jgi:15-cis-phytoene synthase